VRELVLTSRRLEDLIPYARNAVIHDDLQVAQLVASIEEFGWTNPVLIDEAGEIIAGHGRVLAAKALEMTEVPVITLTGLTPAQKIAYRIADNKLPKNAGWDEKLLAIDLQDLRTMGYQLDLTGFSHLELKGLIGPEAPTREGKTADDAVPPPPAAAVAQPGDIWVLGRHRVMVGDATSLGDVQRLMGDIRADLTWTDPPYNVAYEGKAGTIQGDDQNAEAFDRFLLRAFQCAHWAMKPGAVIYVTHADTERWAFTEAFERAGFKLSQVLIWVKNSGILSRQDYNWQHEPILYGWKEGAGHYFAGNYTLTSVIDEDIDPAKLSPKEARELLKTLLHGLQQTVIREDRPTMKPVSLVQRMVEASSREEAVLFDPFGGSGTTLITAEKTNRRAFLLEVDPKYVDVIITRWQDFTGREAKSLTGTAFADAARSHAHKGP
jgi:DNA modification methylase